MARKRNFTGEQFEKAKVMILAKLEDYTRCYLKLGSGSRLSPDEMGAWRGAIRELLKEEKIVKSQRARGQFKLVSDEPTDESTDEPEEEREGKWTEEEETDTKMDDVKELLNDAIALLESARNTSTIPHRNSDIVSAIMQAREAAGLMDKVIGKKVEDD